jgi:TonB-linked SusC/RagA family outer membrane protein
MTVGKAAADGCRPILARFGSRCSGSIAALLVLMIGSVTSPLAAQETQATVSGRVIEADSRTPMAGVNVRVVGTNLLAASDEQGRFTIRNVPLGPRTLEGRRLGYKPARAQIDVGATSPEVTLALSADPLGLETVVVTGYGTASRANVAGAISSLRTETVAELPTPQVDQVLQGRVTGVQVVQNSGVPGSAITVRVRGASSIGASNEPLYVIDGVPLVQGNFSGINGSMGGQDIDALADLNPHEIESIDVLKDASAAAIYGSRASNGVVMITTKRGAARARPEIRINSYYGTQSAWRIPSYLNNREYVELFNEAYANDDQNDCGSYICNLIGFSGDDIPVCDHDNPTAPVCEEFEVDPNVNVDWIREILSSAPTGGVTSSVSGGSERTQYYVSGSYVKQDGIALGYGFDRLNGRVNLDYTATDRLKLGTNVGLTHSIIDRTRGDNTIYGPFANAIATDPFTPVYDESGGYAASEWSGYDNPVGLGKENRAEERTVHIIGNVFANYNLLEGIDARLTVGLDHYNLRSKQYDSPIIGAWVGSEGHGIATNSHVNKLVTDATLNWARGFGRHDLSGVVGTSYELNDQDYNEVEGVQFPTGEFRQLASAALVIGGDQFVTENNLLSFFGRVSHNWARQFTTTINVRADGSSRFGKNNRWGFFPSAAVQWRPIEATTALRSLASISDLALRASYGRTGNQSGIGNFASLGLFSGAANYDDRGGIAPSQLPNPDLRWEKTDQLNIGADVAFFSDRIGLTFDWYRKTTKDLLLARPIPLSTGFGVITENIGSMRNTGIELAARAQVLRSTARNGLNWTTEFNLSANRNKVLKLYDEPIRGLNTIEPGQPLGAFYTFKMDGIFQNAGEICLDATGASCAGDGDGVGFQSEFTVAGDIRFRDTNDDGIVNADDRMIVGSPWPDFEGGLTNNLAWRSFDLSVFVQFVQGNDIYNGLGEFQDAFGFFFDRPGPNARDRWRPDRPSNTQPRASWFDSNNNRRTSSRFLEDGSFVRLKNVLLGYNVPARLARRTGAQSLRVYLQAQNLMTWTDYSGFDPEVNFSGTTNITRGQDFYTLPQARTFTFGFNLGL